MYFTSGSDRAFEHLMQGKPGFDHYDSGEAGAPEDCGDCRFYRPGWKYQFCVYAECPYQPGKLTAYDAVLFQVKGVDDEMAVFRVEKNRGYTVMSNHHLRNKDLSLKAKGLLSQMLSLPEDWDAGKLGLYAERLVPYQPGKHRRHTDGGVGAGKGRVHHPPAEPGRQGQDGRHGLYHLRTAAAPARGSGGRTAGIGKPGVGKSNIG